jgi:ribosomal protein S27E
LRESVEVPLGGGAGWIGGGDVPGVRNRGAAVGGCFPCLVGVAVREHPGGGTGDTFERGDSPRRRGDAEGGGGVSRRDMEETGALMKCVVRRLESAFPELEGVGSKDAAWIARRSMPYWAKACTGMVLLAAPLVGMMLDASLFNLAGGYGTSDAAAAVRRVARMMMDDVDALPRVAFVSVAMASGCVGTLMMRDRLGRQRMRRLAARACCPGCGHSLLGGRRSASGVWCGTCGVELGYGELGLTPRDLGAPLVVVVPTPWCHWCSYVLQGVPVHEGRVTCPECGRSMASMEERVL